MDQEAVSWFKNTFHKAKAATDSGSSDGLG